MEQINTLYVCYLQLTDWEIFWFWLEMNLHQETQQQQKLDHGLNVLILLILNLVSTGEIRCNSIHTGRYISIYFDHPGVLIVCEFEVYGGKLRYSSPLEAMWTIILNHVGIYIKLALDSVNLPHLCYLCVVLLEWMRTWICLCKLAAP